jgi:uncharacterized protein
MAQENSQMQLKPYFSPPMLLKNRHLMTLVPALIPRGLRLRDQSSEIAIIPVSGDSSISAHCHIQPEPDKVPTFILVHGLEGSSDSFYILGLAEKALKAKANVVRINLRNCGNTHHLTPTLYNAGLSQDIVRIIDWLVQQKNLTNIALVGYSLGGNLVLKAAAELDSYRSVVSSVCAISPSIDLETAVTALNRGFNRLYEFNFLVGLKNKISQKQKLFPDRFDISKFGQIKSLRDFDEIYTAPDGGYENAHDYYQKASALPMLKGIHIPTLIIAAQDDPFVPFHSFRDIETDCVSLLAPRYGGHAAFIQQSKNSNASDSISDPFWADNEILTFCIDHA